MGNGYFWSFEPPFTKYLLLWCSPSIPSCLSVAWSTLGRRVPCFFVFRTTVPNQGGPARNMIFLLSSTSLLHFWGKCSFKAVVNVRWCDQLVGQKFVSLPVRFISFHIKEIRLSCVCHVLLAF